MPPAANLGKLDYDLSRLLTDYRPQKQQKIPVVVRVTNPSRLEDVRARLEVLGEIRHVFRPVSAVSAWLSVESLDEVTNWPAVELVELVQEDTVATT